MQSNSSYWILTHAGEFADEVVNDAARNAPLVALFTSPNLLDREGIKFLSENYPHHLLIQRWRHLDVETLESCAKKCPHYAFQYASERMSGELVNQFAILSPREAIRYSSNKLSDEIINDCALKEPELAIEVACGRLSPKLLSRLAIAYPSKVLEYGARYLTLHELISCGNRRPSFALRYLKGLVPTNQMLKWAEMERRSALAYIPDLLPASRLIEYANSYPETALRDCPTYLPVDILYKCARRHPRTAMSAFKILPSDLQNYIIDKEPIAALEEIPLELSPNQLAEIAKKYPIRAIELVPELVPVDLIRLWIRHENREKTIKELMDDHFGDSQFAGLHCKLLEYLHDRLPDELFIECVRKAPLDALRFANHRITDLRIEKLIEGLQIESVPKVQIEERTNSSYNKNISDQDFYQYASTDLISALFDCDIRVPQELLQNALSDQSEQILQTAADVLPKEVLVRCCLNSPNAGIEYASLFISPAQQMECFKKNRFGMWWHQWEKDRTIDFIADEVIDALIDEDADSILRHASYRLSSNQLWEFSSRVPHTAFESAYRELIVNDLLWKLAVKFPEVAARFDRLFSREEIAELQNRMGDNLEPG